MKKKVLVIGNGGREHALGWKIKQSPQVEKVYFAPGNAGTEQLGQNVDIKPLEIDKLIQFVKDNNIDLTVVGPDDPLALGVVDAFQKHKRHIFGPSKKASKLEWSKSFAKKFMKEEHIPTAKYRSFKDIKTALLYIKTQPFPQVIKASGLALGKGVIITHHLKAAEATLKDIMINKIFGAAGDEVIIEEYLKGYEISIHVLSDGKTYTLLPPGKDHKPAFEGNKGPNTGGMGTIVPVPYVDKKLMDTIEKTIIIPTLKGMKKRGTPFVGCLYPGLMITKDGPKVLEFNARFGDPETQSYMRLLDTDLFKIFKACVTQTLSKIAIKWNPSSACCIILASGGYPGNYQKGDVINGLDKVTNPDIVVFQAGTKKQGNQIVTNGGRVLGISSVGKNLEKALEKAYQPIKKIITFKGMQYRKDIGRI